MNAIGYATVAVQLLAAALVGATIGFLLGVREGRELGRLEQEKRELLRRLGGLR